MPKREWFWWRRTVEAVAAVPESECCARPGAVPHDGPCRWCPKHGGSQGVEQTRYTLQSAEYEDYSTDSRLSAILRGR